MPRQQIGVTLYGATLVQCNSLDEEDFREGLEEELSKELTESRWLTTLRLSSREEVENFSLGRRPVGGRWRPPAGWNSCFK